MNVHARLLGASLLIVATTALPSIAPAIETDFLFAWGSPGTADGQFNGPTEITIGPSGAVYVLDRGNQRIQKFDAEGNYVTQWVSARPFTGTMNSLGAATDGNVYVQATYYIMKYDADGNYWAWFGPLGGSSSYSHHLTTDRLGFLYFTSISNGFSRTVRYPSPPAYGPLEPAGGFSSGAITYSRIAIDPAGGAFWAGIDNLSGQFRIFKRTSAGAAVSDWPSANVSDLACDGLGNLYACEPGNGLVRIYDNGGAELATIGMPGTAPGQFQFPTDVAVGADGRIYVVDRDNHRIQVFGDGSTPARAISWGRVKAQYR